MDFRYEGKELERLEALYRLYSRIMEETAWAKKAACSKGCSHCCTCNVTLTGLETAFLNDRLGREGQERAAKNLSEKFPRKRYIPLLTTNGFARACMSGREVPEEENDPGWGRCPLLDKDLCTVYEYRPFGCRAMISDILCGKEGFAQMPPLVLTLNNIFLQYIEHLDSRGVTGNLSDMMGLVLLSGNPEQGSGSGHEKSEGKVIRNSRIPALMVPPEHREIMGAVIEKITALT
ncbi:YkgJ family cysteine cluster protein [Desulfospira joergensenii]|uniref:YkgJ family cysteine cluster protein n=1 Tax=Desulfospira joergensenii TaxID=53329 RepID=UPI0004241BA0|nr:YkgJ family cysteine cluster protein [Desulfospira joergensenii]